ncbi:MAG TPA: histidine phosphatase family protein [Vitreimonas sp.]|nr:histidine phosphatase family protein [Vitreimonas sp.]
MLRHGESTAIVEGRFQGRLDVPLSPLGQREAELAASRLAVPHRSPAMPVPAGPPLEIVHSPLARAAATAEAVGRAAAEPGAFGVDVLRRPDAGFSEIGQGEWEGRLATEIAERWGDVLSAWRQRPAEAHAPGGETLQEVQARVRPALSRLLGNLAEGRPAGPADGPQVLGASGAPGGQPWTILVAHDGVFKVTLLTLFDLPLERFWLFPFALCGISVVEILGGRPRLRAHNLTDHLGPVLEERARALAAERERTGAL